MTPDPVVCPSRAKDGAPRCALESFSRRIPMSAPVAVVSLLIVLLSTLGCFVRAPGLSMSMAEGDTLISVDYEIFGKVQGVFFRKYTQAEGKKLGLVGWVQNTDQGTVKGQLQGPFSKVRHMQEWLETKGSPKSHIDRANFNNEKVILKLDYSDFQIVK
ncbi:acylphosphatase 1 [Rhinolophus ferrumequinum]|uniref:Acylphosphatase n=2 Tax=Rhinolophus ferrumequinum TaxID=59479 RepID=A0A671DLV1_RHIFE|nr:acylphosphatase-1 isoform X9 [Rhinolophus ferrumequinum]KAF6350710.1 acylphosphatase 1 [Rhinolophus ferrumequinum]